MFYQRALAAFRLRRFDLARKELSEELAQNPQNAYALGLLAAASLNLEEASTAVEQAQTAIKANPRLAYPHYILSLACLRLKHSFEAELAIEDALAIEPDNPDFLAVLAGLRIRDRNYSKALALLDQALAENPAHHYALRQKYYVYTTMKRKKDAEEVRRQVLALYPDDAEMHANSGWEKLENPCQREQALEHFEEALRLDPQADNYVEGLLEARFHDKSTIAQLSTKLDSNRFRLFAFSLVCGLIYLAVCTQRATFSVPLFLVLAGSSIILLTLALFAKGISKGIYYARIYLSKEGRSSLPKTTKRKVASNLITILTVLFFFGAGAYCQFVGISEDSLPRVVAADWIPIIGRRYVLAVPLIFLLSVVGAVCSLPAVARFHLKKEARNTKYFKMLYLAVASILVLALFWYVAAFKPGEWFIWFIVPFELILLIVPQTDFVREWIKTEIRKDQERMLR